MVQLFFTTMSVNYNFTINKVTKKNTLDSFSDVIISANYSVSAWTDPVTTGSEEDNNLTITRPAFRYSCGGEVEFNTDGLTEDTFLSFDTVTKTTVKDWIVSQNSLTSIENFSPISGSIDHIRGLIEKHSIQISTDVPGDAHTGTASETAPAE